MKVSALLDQIEQCWQADSQFHIGHNALKIIQGKKPSPEIPQNEIPGMVEKLAGFSFVLKVAKVALAVITALAGYLALLSILALPSLGSLIVLPLSIVVVVDGFRCALSLAKVHSVIDAFCQKKKEAKMPSKGATTQEERTAWSDKFKDVKSEYNNLIIVKFLGEEIPVSTSLFSFIRA